MTTSPNKIQVNTFYDKVAMRFVAYPVMNRQNPYYIDRLAELCLLQLEVEGVNRYGTEEEGTAWESLKRKWRRGGVRYRSFRQRDSGIVVLAQVYDLKLPDGEKERLELLKKWLRKMPLGKDARIGGNRDFGGEHAGLHIPPVHPGRYINVEFALTDLPAILSLDNIPHHKIVQGGKLYIMVDDAEHDEIEQYVKSTLTR